MSKKIFTLFALVCLLGAVFTAPAVSESDEEAVDLQIEDDLEEMLETQPRLFASTLASGFNLSSIGPFSRIDEELEERIESVKNWKFPKADQDKCRGLKKVFDSDIQELNEIGKLEFTYSRKEKELYRKEVDKIQFMLRFSFFRKIAKSVRFYVSKAEKIRNAVTRRQNDRIEQYYREIENRIATIVAKPLGAKLQDKMFRNTTYKLMSARQVREVRKAHQILSECLSLPTMPIKYQKSAQISQKLLASSAKFESHAESLKSDVKFNLLAEEDIASTIFHDAILSVPIESVIESRADDDDDDDDDDDEDKDASDYSQGMKPNAANNQALVLPPLLKIATPKKFYSFISKFVSLLGSINFESVSSACYIPENKQVQTADKKETNVPSVSADKFIDESDVQELTQDYNKIRKNYRFIEDLTDNLVEPLKNYEKNLKNLIRNKIEPKYQNYLEAILATPVGVNIQINDQQINVCKIIDFSSPKTVYSKAQIELALKAVDQARVCLAEFGQVPQSKVQISKPTELKILQIDLSVSDDTSSKCNATGKIIQENVSTIQQRDEYAKALKQHSIVSVKF